MWENYHLEQDPFKRFQMLKDIILVQPYLSAYYETTKLIVEKQKRQEQQQNEKLGYDQDDDIMINDDESKTNAKF